MIIIGILLILLSIRLITFGIKFRDTGHGAKLTNINAIGGGLLLLILGISFLTTDKSFCEVFGFIC
jgi:hypothetical protein